MADSARLAAGWNRLGRRGAGSAAQSGMKDAAAHRVERLGLAVDDHVDGAAGLVRDLRPAGFISIDLLADSPPRIRPAGRTARPGRVRAHGVEVSPSPRAARRRRRPGRARRSCAVRRKPDDNCRNVPKLEQNAGAAPAGQVQQAGRRRLRTDSSRMRRRQDHSTIRVLLGMPAGAVVPVRTVVSMAMIATRRPLIRRAGDDAGRRWRGLLPARFPARRALPSRCRSTDR